MDPLQYPHVISLTDTSRPSVLVSVIGCPPMSEQVLSNIGLGHKTGCMNSVLASSGLCNLNIRMARCSNCDLEVDRIAS